MLHQLPCLLNKFRVSSCHFLYILLLFGRCMTLNLNLDQELNELKDLLLSLNIFLAFRASLFDTSRSCVVLLLVCFGIIFTLILILIFIAFVFVFIFAFRATPRNLLTLSTIGHRDWSCWLAWVSSIRQRRALSSGDGSCPKIDLSAHILEILVFILTVFYQVDMGATNSTISITRKNSRVLLYDLFLNQHQP